MKYTNGWLPTGHFVVAHRHDKHDNYPCPHCDTVHEKDQHLLQCPHLALKAKRQQFPTVTSTKFCYTSNTAQLLRALISQNIIQWLCCNPNSTDRFALPGLPILFTANCSTSRRSAGNSHFLGDLILSCVEYCVEYCCMVLTHVELVLTHVESVLNRGTQHCEHSSIRYTINGIESYLPQLSGGSYLLPLFHVDISSREFLCLLFIPLLSFCP